jgi:hypothetical protein
VASDGLCFRVLAFFHRQELYLCQDERRSELGWYGYIRRCTGLRLFVAFDTDGEVIFAKLGLCSQLNTNGQLYPDGTVPSDPERDRVEHCMAAVGCPPASLLALPTRFLLAIHIPLVGVDQKLSTITRLGTAG